MIVVRLRWDGVSKQQYDECRDKVDWEKNAPNGGVFHVAWFEKNALQAVDVWETADQFNAFVQERLMPVAKGQLNIPGEPVVEIVQAHRMFDAKHGEARS